MSGHRRTNWTQEQIDRLLEMYEAGETFVSIGRAIHVSETSAAHGAKTFGGPDSLAKRKVAVVKRMWAHWPPGSIAQAYRFPASEVRAIAKRLKLGPEADRYVRQERRRASPWDRETREWAERHRHVNREASRIWDMARASKGLPPEGYGSGRAA